MSGALSSDNARLLVLEMSVAALIAQLPAKSMEEVVGMLAFVAGITDTSSSLEEQVLADHRLDPVRHWANEMLERVMSSRKASRPEIESGTSEQ